MICKSINFCWFFFKWGVILGIIALLAAAPFWYRHVFFRVEEELRIRVEATLARRLPHLDVKIQAAHLAAHGIEVRGLSIFEPGADGPQAELAHFDVMFLECQTSPQELLSGEPLITSIRISRPVFRATRRPDGSYSIAKILPLPKPNGPPPRVTIEAGSIEIFDPLKNPPSMLVLRDLNLSTRPVAAPGLEWPIFEFQGFVMADHVRHAEWSGTLDPNQRAWTANGKVDGLDISPELRGTLPVSMAEQLEPLAGLRAPATLKFNISRVGDEPLRFVVDGSVSRGRIEDERLPYPLTDVKGRFHFDNAGFQIRDVTARDGQTIWLLHRFEQQGYAAGSPFMLEAGGQQVHVDKKWAAVIPEKWRKYWYYYQPEGDIDLIARLDYDGQELRATSVDVHCLQNVSFCFHKFPYRLERTSGTIKLRDKVLDISMVGFAGPQPVSVVGNFYNPGPHFTGSIEIEADKIAIDDKLFAAVLSPKAHETLVSLSPTGTFNLDAKLWRNDPNATGMEEAITVTLDASSRCAIAYDKFPYPLENVQGVLKLENDTWTFRDVLATNGSAQLRLSGQASTQPGAPPMVIEISGQQIELNEELRSALQPGVQRLWDALQPHGRFDLAATVHMDVATRKPSIWLRAFPKDDSSIGTSIEPRAFPYRMRLLGGWIDYHDGHAELHALHANHGMTDIRTAGTCDLAPDGTWRLKLTDLAVDRIRLLGEDHELLAALPEPLRRAIGELKPGGPINLRGALDFSKGPPHVPLHVGWDVRLLMHRGSLQVGPRLDNVFGSVRLTGAASGPRFASRGELAVSSLTYKNFQFTDVTGPLWFDNANVWLGTSGPPVQGMPPRPVSARLLGGMLSGDGHVRLGAVPQYQVTFGLRQADLAQFARENLPGNQRLNGKVDAQVRLEGTPGPHNLSGSGTIQLNDADVYDLPVMVSLLKIIRAKIPDSTAFTQGEIAFDIQQGEHFILKEINLEGDAISLSGNGEVTLDGQTNPIRMQLHATGGRHGLPIISGMLSEASKQILLIHVGGTLQHPEPRTETFPVANQALQQLQPDAGQPTAQQAGGFWKTLGFW